ncbi:uncharacterized protein TNCV_3397261 [Trichonephila clavipes]|nr:uncharacterized protein TNCV_3397261 [Trichonephila clavipes]
MVYALPSLQWLLRTVSAYSEPAGATFLAVGVPILTSASVRVVGCSPDDYAGQTIRVISSLSSSSSTARVRCSRGLSSIKMKVWANGTSEQTHMGKKYLLTIAIPDYRPSIENVELSSPVQHNASPDKNSRTTVMVSFLDVTGIKP